MKTLFAGLFAAFFALAGIASHAAVAAAGTVLHADKDRKDDARTPTTGTEQKGEEDKDKNDKDDSKS